ncbi:MAG: DUF2254 domain-containing protein [Actinomycetota bacterium]|nr:DUF2254 domain-containing protein [Actinomycetota bacterium]
MSTRLFRARIWLTSAMWAPVLAANLAAIALGLMLPLVDEHVADEPLLPIHLPAAEQILGAVAGGMITFTSIVFSAVLVAAQIQTSSYSPRVAARLRRDPVLAAALALSTATASYSLFALAALGRQADRLDRDVAPALTIGMGLLLTFATFCGFVALVQRAFDLTQIGGILRGLMRQADRVMRDVHPEAPAAQSHVELPGGETRSVPHDGQPGVIAAVDRAALLRLADQTGAFVEVLPLIGRYVVRGTPVLRLHGGHSGAEPRIARRVLVLARQRTLDQDPAFALRMFVDIAIRGLSPAINDPTTAVQAIDRIETLLLGLHGRRLGPFAVEDPGGNPRGSVPAPTWDEYVDLALTEIRHYGAGSPQVARRLRALYASLLAVADETQRPRIELEEELLDEALGAGVRDARMREILSRPDALGLGGA